MDLIRPDWPMPQIQNVVATVNLDCRLDLQAISQHARNVEYSRKKFHALIMRIREPRTTTLVFASGKMVITGAKSEELARLAGKKHARLIQKVGFETKFKDFKVQNIVASCSTGFYIRLEGFVRANLDFARYEPEIFPGLVYKIASTKTTLLVFMNGKVVITGVKELDKVYGSFASVYPMLLDFKLGPVAPGDGSKKKR
ncbi:TATA-box-binding protein [Podospora aff. communis PSN243]|uniref:TATA-box-binding protein n=1 Tax=Podospora aff. communis PSN243 TaxID=3040156 RepID=A0AAV9H0Y3_9PEZI|nr:TATA-box-binding protein [Podospora aff. communis PSN243]